MQDRALFGEFTQLRDTDIRFDGPFFAKPHGLLIRHDLRVALPLHFVRRHVADAMIHVHQQIVKHQRIDVGKFTENDFGQDLCIIVHQHRDGDGKLAGGRTKSKCGFRRHDEGQSAALDDFGIDHGLQLMLLPLGKGPWGFFQDVRGGVNM